MRLFITISLISLVIFSLLPPVGADELSDAYVKEYTFLKAQKEELARRLQKENEQQNREIELMEKKVKNLQDAHMFHQNRDN